ncbi:MAG: M24 family metallopeptidase [Candidatus Limnocylindrales bacterium]
MTTPHSSPVRHDRIERAQALMREQGVGAIMVLNHDDYRWFFGFDRTQPRAIIPADGPPAVIAFTAEEPEMREAVGDGDVMVWGSIGGQINDVVTRIRALRAGAGEPGGVPFRVAIQQWFDTPAFLVDLFRRVNPGVEVVSSDPIMDPLRAVKEPDELERMAAAQRIAGLGMDRGRALLRDGATAHEVATEALYAMLREGAERTSTPVYVNVGRETCMLHGWVSPRPMRAGDLVVIDLTPVVDGYCANLARTFVLGEPDERQRSLLDAYAALTQVVRDAMRPGATIADLDALAGRVLRDRGLADLQVNGIGHGIGLRFEETPASTIIPPHRNVPLQDGMTVTIGHTILAVPGFGGVRHEDVHRVTSAGGELLATYPVEPIVGA